jgi:uncharacterized protein (DUF4415 family)
MPKLKPGTTIPTDDETAAINAGINAEVEARELDSEWHKGAKPASEVLAPQAYAALVAVNRPRGLSKADETKVFTAIRLDADFCKHSRQLEKVGRPA